MLTAFDAATIIGSIPPSSIFLGKKILPENRRSPRILSAHAAGSAYLLYRALGKATEATLTQSRNQLRSSSPII